MMVQEPGRNALLTSLSDRSDFPRYPLTLQNLLTVSDEDDDHESSS